MFALASPGPGSPIVFVLGPVVFAINTMSLILQSLKATFTLSGSTCLVLLSLTATAVERLIMLVSVISIVPAVLAQPLLALLVAVTDANQTIGCGLDLGEVSQPDVPFGSLLWLPYMNISIVSFQELLLFV